MIAALTFLGGLAGLLVAGNLVVNGASALGAKFGLTPMVIGLTIVAAGTSAPELAVVFRSIATDDTELAVGSIIGSNIANVLLVLGIAVLFGSIKVSSRIVRVDIPIMIGASVAFLLFSLNNQLEQWEGACLLAALIVFVVWTLRAAPREEQSGPDGTEAADASEDEPAGPMAGRGFPAIIGALVVGIAGLALAAGFVVSGAEEIATSLGVPELIVGLTILALGTSAPEIVTTIIAAMRGRRDLAVGNAVGSNIFNILLVMGATTTVTSGGISIGEDAVQLDLPILVVAALACLPMVVWDHQLDRWEGGVFVAYYLAYVVFLILDGTGHGAKEPFLVVLFGFVVPLTVLTIGVVTSHQRRSKRPSDDPAEARAS